MAEPVISKELGTELLQGLRAGSFSYHVADGGPDPARPHDLSGTLVVYGEGVVTEVVIDPRKLPNIRVILDDHDVTYGLPGYLAIELGQEVDKIIRSTAKDMLPELIESLQNAQSDEARYPL